ncbi:aldolase/citrate lyase family protein [Pseudomonas sp. dw_358]|uniref:HpcH/HpaI aldolase family protein n=1 Tax=Pseudomonas sp. dw_358 TaxID=2720083 RepID=UPI001BD5CA04|nr:aldolase/citrate lyase family protein [Pseudomonas sp. dw_358]
MLRTSRVFQRLHDAEPVHGVLNSLPSPLLCEMIAAAGYDYLILDLEHLLRDGDELMHCLRACEAAGISPWVRLAEVDGKLIGRLLDAGVEAIVLSRVESVEQIIAAQQAAYFPPRGQRGITGGRCTGFGQLALPEYIELANRVCPIVPMIESAAGLRALPEIVALPGIALVMEGALDLALDLGLGPQPAHPLVWDALQGMAVVCEAAGVAFCANPRNAAQQAHWQAHGVLAWLAGEDRGLLQAALKERLSNLQHPSVATKNLK